MKELLTAIQIGHIDKFRNVANAIQAYNLTREWMTYGASKGRTPLHLASSYGYHNTVRIIVNEIIETNKDATLREQFINVRDHKGRTPLFHATAKGHINIIRFLLDHDADLAIPTNENHSEPGSTPLMVSAGKNDAECFELLLSKGASILEKRKDGADAIYIAARYGHINIIRKICEANKTRHVVNRPSFRGRTALITAAMHNHLGICKALYDKGADLDCQDDDKFTALIYASRQGYGLLVRWLVEHGANVNLRNSNGKTALIMAEENGRDKIAYYLHRCRGIIKSPNIKESLPQKSPIIMPKTTELKAPINIEDDNTGSKPLS